MRAALITRLGKVAILFAAAIANPLAAQEQQFDLFCDYGELARIGEYETTTSQTPPQHLQVDLTNGKWCDGSCWESDISEIASLSEGEIVLTAKTGVGFEGTPSEYWYFERLVYNRDTGLLTKVSESDIRGNSTSVETATCKEQAFGGLSRSEFKPPRIRNQSRLYRAMDDTETGKAMKKLAPEGTTKVAMIIQVNALGKPVECSASAPDPLPEFEAAVCKFMTRKEVTFYPARNPKGEDVAGEFRLPMVFADH